MKLKFTRGTVEHTDDIVRMYLREAGRRPLLTRGGEVEVANLHGGNDHVEGLFPGGAHRGTHLSNVGEHLQNILIEAEIADAGGDASILDEASDALRAMETDFALKLALRPTTGTAVTAPTLVPKS